jgi:glycosyltransferase involved in cell wall biosynthesis
MDRQSYDPDMPELSVVIPVYGCEPCLSALHSRLRAALEDIGGDVEVIYVDDGSRDGAWQTLTRLARADDRVRLVRLSRNFGQHAAITAGLAETTGGWVAVLDCDLQDPPEEIPRLYAKALEGYDVVLARRSRRRGHWSRRLTGQAYYRLRNAVFKTDMYTNYTNLSVISRRVVDAFLTLRDKDRQYLLIVDWLGFRRTAVEIEHRERYAGKSAYDWRALLKVAIDGMFFQSTVLLRWIVYVGFGLAALGVMLAAYTLLVYALGRQLPDWTGLPVLLLVLTGFIIISTGVTGLYVGKIFDQVKGRPLYVVEARVIAGEERELVPPLAAELPGDAQPESLQPEQRSARAASP